MRFSRPPTLNPVIAFKKPTKEWSITRLLLLIGTPLMALVMLLMTISTYRIASHHLHQSYARTAHTKALAQANEIEQTLVEARLELQNLAHESHSAETIQKFLMNKPQAKRNKYAEIAFHSVEPGRNFLLLNTGESIWRVPDEKLADIKFGAFTHRERIGGKIEDYVQIDQPVQVYYTSVPYLGSVENMEFAVIRLSTPVLDQTTKTFLGYLTLSLDIVEIQRIMTLYASSQSPLYIYPQEKERLRSFFFDAGGWLICETGPSATSRARVSIDDIRTGLQGDIGRQGFEGAFRPSPQYEKYWAVVSAVQAGKDGGIDFSNFLNEPDNPSREHYLYYVPIRFLEDAAHNPVIVGGIGCVDGGFLLKSSRYEMSIALAISWVCALVLTMGALFYLNRRISRPIGALTSAAQRLALSDGSSTLDFPSLPQELSHLQQAMNMLLQQLQTARNKAKSRQYQAFEENQRQPVCLESASEADRTDARQSDASPATAIVGNSQAVRSLNVMIHKAAQVVADVLIVGETGTGKELAAEAIHNASPRSAGPFISINCGALDENLLMDALFGHVKGAFSEAKTERKGAFLAASGGTLHLDEIGNASTKVQQSLLRALAARTITPLGSDEEIPFDARVIAATNVDLLEYVRNGSFREDLYYRLAVITVFTPPLRERKEDIPALVRAFLAETARFSGKTPPKLSWGALDKLLEHDWPGNIRELKNIVTRSMTFAEGRILLAEHIAFGQSRHQVAESEPSPVLPSSHTADIVTQARPSSTPNPRDRNTERTIPIRGRDDNKRPDETDDPRMRDLNPRQKKAWPTIAESGGTNRAHYQRATGDHISVRTAQYDLQDLVNRGLLIKSGRGPSSRYIVATPSR